MPPKTPDTDFKIFLAMAVILVVPAALTLRTVTVPRGFVTAPDPSPYGYTWSLTIFLTPVLVLGWWFLRHPSYRLERKAFWVTIGFFTAAGLILDIVFGHTFFVFKNTGATLGLHLPGYIIREGRFVWDVPVEEVGFYFLGSLFMLLFYIWGDLYWFGVYDVDYEDVDRRVTKIVKPHLSSAVGGLVIIGAAIIYKKFGPHPYHAGFPGYLTILVIGFVMPTLVFFRTVKPFVNWRSFSLTLYSMWLISIFWEATLGVPYQWWGYRFDQMVGLVIGAWSNLPIEEPLLWTMAGWGTVLIYETVRIYLHMDRSFKEAFFG